MIWTRGEEQAASRKTNLSAHYVLHYAATVYNKDYANRGEKMRLLLCMNLNRICLFPIGCNERMPNVSVTSMLMTRSRVRSPFLDESLR